MQWERFQGDSTMRKLMGLEVLLAVATMGVVMPLGAQEAAKYEPTLESLDRHPLPAWYAGAKLGIFIHWGLYSVPGCRGGRR